jgi:hypothetical protein
VEKRRERSVIKDRASAPHGLSWWYAWAAVPKRRDNSAGLLSRSEPQTQRAAAPSRAFLQGWRPCRTSVSKPAPAGGVPERFRPIWRPPSNAPRPCAPAVRGVVRGGGRYARLDPAELPLRHQQVIRQLHQHAVLFRGWCANPALHGSHEAHLPAGEGGAPGEDLRSGVGGWASLAVCRSRVLSASNSMLGCGATTPQRYPE